MTEHKTDTGFSERELVVYLKEHPDFFSRHEYLLTELHIPHPETGEAISLMERQVAILREQKRDLSRKLQHLAQVARSNEQLLERMQGLILELIDSHTLAGVLAVMDRAMRGDFHADAVAVKLFHESRQGATFVSPDDAALKDFGRILADRRPVCGYLKPNQKAYLFGVDGDRMSSGAVIPLCEGHGKPCVGMLGIGSTDAKRFHPEMGTVFLNHLGAVAARVIKARLGL